MSALAIQAPLPIPAFRRDHQWEPIRSSTGPQLPRLDTSGALPSIRELVPEHILNSQPTKEAAPSRPGTLTSPAALTPGSHTSPRYVHSSHEHLKRRRPSVEDEQELDRSRQVPRLYNPSAGQDPLQRRESPFASSRSDGYTSEAAQRPAPSHSAPALSPRPHEILDRPDARHPYQQPPPPAPPKHVYDGEAPPTYRPEPQYATDPFHRRMPQPASHTRTPSFEQQRVYRTGSASGEYGYPPHQPPAAGAVAPRYVSATAATSAAYERSPFTGTPPFAPHHHYNEYARYGSGDMGTGSLAGETKQRKRRGNLPKETTDKLRAWFMAHLTHPYPTEDEKQELMRQTGLQMNQISNWFINARRRQLPTMINDARAESDAMHGRSLSAKSESNGYEHARERLDHHSDGERHEEHYAKRGGA